MPGKIHCPLSEGDRYVVVENIDLAVFSWRWRWRRSRAEEKKAEQASDIPATLKRRPRSRRRKPRRTISPKWIKQLDADKFADRQAASEETLCGGQGGDSRVDRSRRRRQPGSDRPLDRSLAAVHGIRTTKRSRTPRKKRLEKIAQSSKAGAARRAKQALNPEQEPEPQFPMGDPNESPTGLDAQWRQWYRRSVSIIE